MFPQETFRLLWANAFQIFFQRFHPFFNRVHDLRPSLTFLYLTIQLLGDEILLEFPVMPCPEQAAQYSIMAILLYLAPH